ncbi:glutamine amidotransferase [Ruegeria sp. SCP11]|uniref:glutamine amidotransferase n=1 Tax=Ruegeria sp. SCP11 TaxID=3141378 RepID=UPI00333AE455
MKRFLILQLRPETEASDAEYASILDKTGLSPDQTHRIRLDCEDLPNALDVTDYAGVIVGGGPGCVSDDPATKSEIDAHVEAAIMGLMPQITAQDHPFMGCCYGLGILAAHLGGDVSKDQFGEPVGPSTCHMTEEGARDPLTSGLGERFDAFVGHKEAVQALPDGCVHLLASDPCPFQMIRWGQNVYATQFHPEANAQDFEQRINIYKDFGYFPPEDAQRLIDICHAADVTQPGEILRRFVERYK